MLYIITLLSCACAEDATVVVPEGLEAPAEPATEAQEPEEVAQDIKDAASPQVQEQLELLRAAVYEMHGEEAVRALMDGREEALRAASEELAEERAKHAKAKSEAIATAVQKAKDEPAVIDTSARDGD